MKRLSSIGCGWLAGLGVILLATSSSAMIPEPDVIFYGEAIGSEGAVTSGVVNLRLNGNGSPVASYVLGTDPRALNRYVLRVPLDLFDPRVAGTARPGESAGIYLDGVLLKSVTIPAKGSAVAVSAVTDLADSDGDGLADAWEKRYFGTLARDGRGDLNRNGISDLQEYLSGNDPGNCVWTPIDDAHVETLVDNPLVLQSCLRAAENDLHHNLIKAAQGIYHGNFTYTATLGEDFDLRLVGGYDPDTAGLRHYSAALTILDGDTDNDGVGNGRILTLDTATAKVAGTIAVDSLHLIRGKAPAGESGGGVLGKSFQGDMLLIGNWVSDSSATSGGGIAITTDAGRVLLANNIISANNATSAAAVSIIGASGTVTLLNNTLADNDCTVSGDGQSLVVESTGGAVDLTNNIIVGGAAQPGADISVTSAGVTIPLQVRNNAFASGAFATTVPGFGLDPSNADRQPLFISSATGDYHLQKVSTCINAGFSNHPQLPARDVDGDARIYGKERIVSAAVDIGADEQSLTDGLDLNGNGALEIGDAMKVYRSVLGYDTLTVEEQLLADVAPLGDDGLPKGNGGVDVADLILIMRRIIGLENW